MSLPGKEIVEIGRNNEIKKKKVGQEQTKWHVFSLLFSYAYSVF